MSYAITYELGTPHGKAVGIFLAGYVSCYKEKEEANRILNILGFDSIEAFASYLKELLGEVEISNDLLDRDIDDLLANRAKLKNYPFEITKEELLRFL